MLTRIFHPTDFSPASEVAFVHALKLALTHGGSLTIFHYARAADAEGDRCPVLAAPTLG